MSRSRRNPKDYWYPDMSNAIIVDSLNERGVAITHQQLVSPTAQSTLNIYSGCLQLLTGLTPESLREPVEDALIAADEPNLVCRLTQSILVWRSDLMTTGHIRTGFQHQHPSVSYVCMRFFAFLIVLTVSEFNADHVWRVRRRSPTSAAKTSSFRRHNEHVSSFLP